MRRMFCQALLLLSSALSLVAFFNIGILDDLLLMVAMAAGLYAIMRAVRDLLRRVAPVMRWLVVLVFFAGLIYLGGREILELGADGVLVVAVLALIIWAVLCPTDPKRARA